MFERFSESARRVVFYARWEASNYGSGYIESEHLLLGLVRENASLARCFPQWRDITAGMRDEVEKRITRRERTSLSVEVPLSVDCKRALTLAAQTSERLGHRIIEPEHVLVGILRVETSLAAQILMGLGLKPDAVEERVAKGPFAKLEVQAASNAARALNSWLSGLRSWRSDDLIDFFAERAVYIDAAGTCWSREETWKRFEALFAAYAKKNASYRIEATHAETDEMFAATVLWKNALLASEERSWVHRMSFVLAVEGGGWRILLLQVTAVQGSSGTS